MTERLEGICERITAALEYVPFARYDDTTKLAENALGELLAALEAAEADARQARERLSKIRPLSDGEREMLARQDDVIHEAQRLSKTVDVVGDFDITDLDRALERYDAARAAALGRA